MNNSKKILVATVLGSALLLMGSASVFAQTTSPKTGNYNRERSGVMMGRAGMMNGVRPAVVGTVTAINGTTLTVQSGGMMRRSESNENNENQSNDNESNEQGTQRAITTYTVDASNATIYKNNATSSVSNISVNDRVIIQGTISGTNVTASVIRDGMMLNPRQSGSPGMHFSNFRGNGQPVVAGTVSSISGSSITVTTSSNTSYSVDATNATIMNNNATSTLSSITTGDYVIVQGTINGNSVTASAVIDGKTVTGTPGSNSKPGLGFFGMIGQFFRSIFGF